MLQSDDAIMLHEAARNGHIIVVKLLLTHGADTKKVNKVHIFTVIIVLIDHL